MAKGSVIEYPGKRGTVFRIKYEDADKRQVMETLGRADEGWTRKKAEAELRERLVRVERKGYRKPKPLTFASYAESWFAEEATKRRWKPKTVQTYRFVRERLVEAFGPMKLDQVRPRHVADFIGAMSATHGASSVHRDVAVLHAIFKSALAAELVQANPVDGAELPKLPAFRPSLQPNEIGRVANAFTVPQWRTVFLTATLTGLRCCELQGLRWRDVSLTERTLRIVESKSEDGRRLVGFGEALADELEQHYRRTTFKGDDERVFVSGNGSKYWTDGYRPAFKKALAKAGIDRRDDARHGALTAMASNGAAPVTLMTVAGHASMQTTKRYLHLAGVVFHDDAAKLEARQLSTELSTGLSAPQRTSDDPSGLESGLET
jgi:integrase